MRLYIRRIFRCLPVLGLIVVLFISFSNNQLDVPVEDNKVLLTASKSLKSEEKTNGTEKGKHISAQNETGCFQIKWNSDFWRDKTRQSCEYITIASTEGRLGNQMFRIASLVGIAHRLGFVPVIPDLPAVSRWFQLPNTDKITLQNSSIFAAPDCCKYYNSSEHLVKGRNWTLHGYLQSWRYFHTARPFIKQTFKIKPDILKNVESFTKSLRLSSRRLVGVHIRRRDMTLRSSVLKGYATPSVEYILKAMTYFKETTRESIKFIVVSDDMAWCKNNVKGDDITYSPFNDAGSDMALLTSCDHVIVTSGTFGWWGGWLSGGSVVYFAGFPSEGSPLGKETNKTDYYPPDWIGLE